jgi:oligosaccharyl transferase (archaeosortase A-associated)
MNNDESTSWVKRHRADIIASLLVALFFGISLFIRVYLPYDRVFVDEWVKFTSVDAYFQMRLVDSLVHNFPRLINFDPYLLYPFGMNIDNIHFFNWFLAGITWVAGLGSPTQHTIDVIAVYFPTVLAALAVIPIFFIGKELFGRWAGVIAAGLMAILPGEYLGRSILGFTDHHVAETLLTATTMMFLIMAVKRAKENGLTLKHLQHRDWAVIRKPVIYSALAGLFLGIYLITWIGGLLFVFIILLYLFIQFIIDHLKRNRMDYLLPAGTIPFLVALIIYVIFVGGTFATRPSSVIPGLSLLIAVPFPFILLAISLMFTRWNIKSYYYPITLCGLGVAAVFIGRAIYPDFMRNVLDVFNMFASRTIIEMQPFLHPREEWTPALAWGNFNTNFFLFPSYIEFSPEFHWFQKFLTWFPGLSIISLGILVYLIIKRGDADKTMLVTWSLVILLATIGQRRFAYYLVANVALLTGFLSWQFFKMNKDVQPRARHINIFISIALIIFLLFYEYISPIVVAVFVALFIAYLFWQFSQIFGILRFSQPKPEMPKKGKHKGGPSARPSSALYYVNIAVVVIILFFLVFFPNITPAKEAAATARYAPSNAWVHSLNWLKENTPEPFADPDFYYRLYESPPSGERYQYPDSAYAIMTWVDYGYWIARIAHRPVNLTPGPGGFYVATYLLSQDANSSREVEWKTAWEQEMIPESEIIDKLGAKYIILDNDLTTNKLHALAFWSEQELEKYYEYCLEPHPDKENTFVGALYLHPEYYRSLAVRLYNFDGKAVTPEQIEVISYHEQPLREGGTVKVVDEKQFFPSYEEAKSYIAEQESGQFQIVSESPFISAVPLEELENFKLIYGSPESFTQPGVNDTALVKIFEYVK